jgi:outer membrane protein OmpA-like peptidoglycan-associated protein
VPLPAEPRSADTASLRAVVKEETMTLQKSLRRRIIALAVLPLAFSSGCMTNDPYTQERETSKTTKGAVIGALTGAAAGLITGRNSRSRRKRALIGAGVGTLAGAAVGQYMDRQETALRERLAKTGVGVTRMGDDIQLVMPGNVTFETNQSAVRADFYDVLNDVALKEYDKTLVEVTGYTDSTGDDAYNQSLSERRSESVLRYLASQGVQEMRLASQGFGEQQPIASNDTPEGREQNRRVEIRLLPLTGE